MKYSILGNVTVLLAAGMCLLGPSSAHATATADSQITFTNLAITPAAGSLIVLSNWGASAFAQASASSQFGAGTNSQTATATGDFSSALGHAGIGTPSLNVDGNAYSICSIPGVLEASDSAAGHGSLSTYFMITGGSGSVNVSFSLDVSLSLNVFTDAYGELAEAESIFSLEVNGAPTLFHWEFLSIGPNDSASTSLLLTLNDSALLQYNTAYFLFLEGDAETLVSNVPEPTSAALVLLGFVFLWLWRGKIQKRAQPAARGSVTTALGLAIFGAALSFANVSHATYIGAEAPNVCDTCGPPPNRTPGGNAMTSLSEGNFREEFPVTVLKSSRGPTLPFSLTYNSYNADGSRARTDTGMGFGWTHSYNLFLFSQRSHLFRMDADGRVTQFRRVDGGTYTADTGFFEVITANPDGSFTITNKNQSWWRYATVPNTPYLVGGPIYRLTQMGDRNQNLTSLTYSNGLLAAITDQYGRALTLGYTNASKLSTVTDPLGRTTRFTYDAAGRVLTRVTDADGKFIRYTYNSLYQMNRKIDRDGRMYFYLYQKQKPSSVVDGLGQTLFSLTNANQWAVDRNALALWLRRIYVPGTAIKTDGNSNVWRYAYNTNGYITRITAPDTTITAYTYDPATRQLATMTNANGAVTLYQYDSRGNRISLQDALGNVTTYAYDTTFNQVTNMTDPGGRTTTYQYDARGNLTNQVDALGASSRWSYDLQGNILSQTDKLGRTTTYSYDSFGNRTNMSDALGNTTRYTYDAVGNQTSTTDPLGRTTTYTYDSLNRRVATTNALGGTTTYTYDALDRRVRETDANGRSTSYSYDDRARLTSRTNALGGVTTYQYDRNDNLIADTNERGHTTTYGYDTRNRLITSTNALGGTNATTYDSVGNTLSQTDPHGHVTTYTYDALDRRVTQTDALGNLTRYDYAAPGGPPCCTPTIGSGLVTRREDANGHVTFYKYDELDRMKQVIQKSGDTNDLIDLNDAATTYTYDSVGNRLSVTEPNGNITTSAYDSLNRATNIVNGAGDTTTYTYDGVGNQVSATTPNGHATVTMYDGLNRVSATYDGLGWVTTNTYDAVGNRLTAVDGNGHTTTYTYDALDRRTTVTDPMGRTTTYSYDAVGNTTSTLDRSGNVTAYTYDGLNRRTQTTNALGNTTTYSYDAGGNLSALTDANGNATTYAYDALDRVIRETYPDAAPNTRTNFYDAVGNVTNRTDQMGRTTRYTYDDLYRPTNILRQPSGIQDKFIYDLSGRMTAADRAGWVTTFTYDAGNRVTNSTQNGQIIRYTYDIPGRTRRLTYPSGRQIIERTDGRNRLASVEEGAAIASYTYDPADRALARAYANGVVATYTYNSNSWVTAAEHMLGLTRIVGFGYDYDNEGNRRYEEKRHLPADSEAYRYDAIYRLTNFDAGTLSGPIIPSPSFQKSWDLDPVGNWNSVSTNGVPELRTHNAANEIVLVNGSPLLHDDAGNLQQDTDYTYTYDEANRLTQVVRNSDSAVVGQYFYDALGRRIIKIANASGTATTNVYFYDGLRLIEEQNQTGATLATYTYGNYVDEVLTMTRGSQTNYYHQNALWSPQALTDAAGSPVERYLYDAYGLVAVLDGGYTPVALNAWGTPHSAVTNSFLFTGRELDEETGLFHFRARALDGGKGRFVQRDPLDSGNGANRYEYVESRPTLATDPSGMAGVPTITPSESEWKKVKGSAIFTAIWGRCCYKVEIDNEYEERVVQRAGRSYRQWRNVKTPTSRFVKPLVPVPCTGPVVGSLNPRGQWHVFYPPWILAGEQELKPDQPTLAPSAFAEAAPAGTEGSGGYAPQMLGD